MKRALLTAAAIALTSAALFAIPAFADCDQQCVEDAVKSALQSQQTTTITPMPPSWDKALADYNTAYRKWSEEMGRESEARDACFDRSGGPNAEYKRCVGAIPTAPPEPTFPQLPKR
jgi:hypothetical protein